MDISKENNFFLKLKKVCKYVENGVADIQKDFSDINTQNNPATAICSLSLKRKETLELRREIQARTEHMQQTGEAFHELLTVCDTFCQKTRDQLNKVELYMKQYGYCKPEKNKSGKQDETTGKGGDSETAEISNEKTGSSTPKRKSSENVCNQMPKTPKLEDFGISQYTLSLLNKGKLKENEEPLKKAFPYQSSNYLDEESSSVPAIFRHNGVVVTPSVHGGKIRTPGRQDNLVDDLDGTWYRTPANQRKVKNANYNQYELSKTPPSPELLTPSLNRLAPFAKTNKQENPPIFSLNEVKCNEEPVFSTPNFSQMLKKTTQSQMKTSDGCASPFFPNAGHEARRQGTPSKSFIPEFPSTPKSPELTSQIFFQTKKTETKAMSQSNTNNSSTKPGASTYSVCTFSETPQTPELTYHFEKKKTVFNEVPQNIEMLSDKLFNTTTPDSPVLLSKIMTNKSQSGEYKAQLDTMGGGSFETPETPKLLGKYYSGN